jgi:hypothetical protein
VKKQVFSFEFAIALIAFICATIVIVLIVFKPFETKIDYSSEFKIKLPLICKNEELIANLDVIDFGNQFINIEYYYQDSDLLQDLAIHSTNTNLDFFEDSYRISDCSLFTIKRDVVKFPEVANVTQVSQYVFDILNINKNTLFVTGEKNEFILNPLDSKTLEENQIQSIKIVEKE